MSPDLPLPPADSLAATRFTIGDFEVSFGQTPKKYQNHFVLSVYIYFSV